MMVHFILCFVIFNYELRIIIFFNFIYPECFPPKRNCICFFWEPWIATDLEYLHFYHPHRGLHFTQDSKVQICLFLPAVWFSAFIIRTTKYFMHFLPTPLFSACFFSIYWRFPYSICVIQQILYFMWYLFLFFELRALPQII